MVDDLGEIAALAGDLCATVIHTEGGQSYACQGRLRLSLRDRRDRLALPVLVCTNPRCGTAKVQQGGAP